MLELKPELIARREVIRLSFLTIATVIATSLTVHVIDARSNVAAASTMCVTLDAFSLSSDLAMELVYRDIEVRRSASGRVTSIDYASSYRADVTNFDELARFLIAGYQSFKNAELQQTANEVNHTIYNLARLPSEGESTAAMRDLAQVIDVRRTVLNQYTTLRIPGWGS